jgi:hypothetical protein
MRLYRLWRLSALATILSFGVGACSTAPAAQGPTHEFAAASFRSAEQLMNSSDLVVLGRPVSVLSRELDAGGEAELDSAGRPEPGAIPMVFLDFSIDKVLRGSAPSREIPVGVIDVTKMKTSAQTELRLNAPVVLFLRLNKAEEAPGISTVGDHYVPLSGDNGIFDVVNSRAMARSAVVTSVGARDTASQPATRISVPMDTLLQLGTTATGRK